MPTWPARTPSPAGFKSARSPGRADARGLWPPIVPTVVLVESLTSTQRGDANVNRLVKACDVRPLVVTLAEPGGTVLTSDVEDLGTLAASATDIEVELV